MLEKSLKELILKTIRFSNGVSFENLLDEYIAFSEDDIQATLNDLLDSNVIWKEEENKYTLLEQDNIVIGRFLAHEKGFGFVERLNSEEDDIFIEAKYKNDAMHTDIVMVKVKKMRAKSDEGKIIKVIERGLKRAVGTFKSDSYGTYVVPDEKRLPIKIFIPSEYHLNAVSGHKVVVDVYDFLPDGNARGKIKNILGHVNDPGVDILSIVHKHAIPHEFEEETLEHANEISDVVSDEEIMSRRDLRRETIVTIDGSDAKDLDDAVNVKRLPNGNYLLGVHIADVSHYVTPGSPMDKDAYLRGTSVYLVDRVIPMIPHRLSNGICSLNPRVDRLTLSCEMEFDPTGKLVEYDIFQSVINTCERMTYDDVNLILSRSDKNVVEKYSGLVSFFDTMYELSLILRKRRFDGGAIDFDIKEAKILVDDECKPTEIHERSRGEAERLIEDFMLAANDTVAMHLSKQKLPGMYRIHEQPNPSKLYHFANFITNFGYRFIGSIDGIKPKQLQTLLNKIKGSKEETIISKVLLRSMSQAKYSNENLGHFGLAKENYTHFTSPIRRYPDLMVHRLIRDYVVNKKNPSDCSYNLAEIAEHTSMCERRAVEAERETQELKKTEFMKEHIGEVYSGVISSVTKFGFFVELPNTIEGLVHVSSLNDDHYEFDQEKLILVGKNKKKVYSLGDPITIKLTKTDIEERRIYFEPFSKPKQDKKKQESLPEKKTKKSFKDRFDKLYK